MTFSPEAPISYDTQSSITASPAAPTLSSKRSRGIYYTKGPIVGVLSDWAVQSSTDRILEPSFGEGHFVEALASAFESRDRQSDPYGGIYGFDLDERLFAGLTGSAPRSAPALPWMAQVPDVRCQFRCKNFLRVRADIFGSERFAAVVGNPPYVPHHALSDDDKRDVTRALSDAGTVLDGKSSLWAPFVVHATTFLREGGRMAWVLPSSFLHAAYAEPVRQLIASSFRRSIAVTLGQRLFEAEGAAEATVVVLAEGWRQGGSTTRLAYAESVEDLGSTVEAWASGHPVGRKYDDRPARVLASDEALAWVRQLGGQPLGELADVKIGLVTGDNQFFVVDGETAARWKIPREALRPVMASSSFVPSIDLSDSVVDALWESGRRCFLVHAASDDEWGPALARYTDTYPEDKRTKNVTFRKREHWDRPDDGAVPHAFLPYMYQRGPRLIVNTAQVNATNSVHRVYLKEPDADGTLAKRIALSVVSTFGQLSAELEGRSYGAGVLKLEPSEAKRLRVLLPDVPAGLVERVFKEVDRLLTRGDVDAARAAADEVVLASVVPLERGAAVDAMTRAIERARKRRWVTKR